MSDTAVIVPTRTDFVMVRLVNDGELPFDHGFDGQRFMIPGGQAAYVPYDACVTWFGDPRLEDKGIVKDRSGEIERIRARWGAYEHEALWVKNRPQIRTFDLQGNEVFFLAFDIDGTLNAGNDTPVGLTQEQMFERMLRMESEIEAMRQHLGRDEAVSAEGVGTDGDGAPESVTVPASGPAAVPARQGGPPVTVSAGEEPEKVTPPKVGRVSPPKVPARAQSAATDAGGAKTTTMATRAPKPPKAQE